jgi:hypothetical protein
VQRIEPGPDDEIEDQQADQLVEAADEAILRETSQEQQFEPAGKVAE